MCELLTWANAKDEVSIPKVAMAPPRTAVRLNPMESIKIPASGDTKKVIPIESDPTRAEIETYKDAKKYIRYKIQHCRQFRWNEKKRRLASFENCVLHSSPFHFRFQLEIDDAVTLVYANGDAVCQETSNDDEPGVKTAVGRIIRSAVAIALPVFVVSFNITTDIFLRFDHVCRNVWVEAKYILC